MSYLFPPSLVHLCLFVRQTSLRRELQPQRAAQSVALCTAVDLSQA
jgi:hypothetical protein